MLIFVPFPRFAQHEVSHSFSAEALKKKKKLIYFYLFNVWLHWVFIALQGLSLTVENKSYSWLRVTHAVVSLVAEQGL